VAATVTSAAGSSRRLPCAGSWIRYLDTADPAKALAEALRGRQVSLADWEVGMRRVVKNTHLNAIALERGGWANMTPADYGRAGQIIREQYGYLKGFARHRQW
jgi:hypothetical protein